MNKQGKIIIAVFGAAIVLVVALMMVLGAWPVAAQTARKKSTEGRRIGVLFGVNYINNAAGIPPLDLAEKDAQHLGDALKRDGQFDEVKVFLGGQVTATNVKNELTNLARSTNANDTIVLYFSGHGTTQRDTSAPDNMRNYLVMYNRPHLSDDQLDDWLKPIKAKKTVWVFDACFSGGLVQKGRRGVGDVPIAGDQQGAVMENRQSAYFTDKILVASSAANEPSLEVTGRINHGLFTYYFTEGFKPSNGDLNRDGAITLLEAFEWSSVRVQAEAKKLRRVQTPQITGNASGVFIAGTLPKEPPKTQEPPKDQKPQKTEEPSKTEETVTGGSPVPVFTPGTVPPVLQDTVSVNQPVVQDPAPVDPSEPPPSANPQQPGGEVVIYTTIFESYQAGPVSMNPQDLLRRKNQKGQRSVRVALSGQELDSKIEWIDQVTLKQRLGEDVPLGDHYDGKQRVKNRVAAITIKNAPPGVHQITIAADGYPVIMERLGVEGKKKNQIFVPASLSGYGSIQGRVFLKNFDTPLPGQQIWMPTVKAPNMIHKMKSSSDGSFWFLNLPPGDDYFLKPGFGADQPLDNKLFTVKDGQVTRLDVVLKEASGMGIGP